VFLVCDTVSLFRFDPLAVERTEDRDFGMGFRNFSGSRFNVVLVLIESACPCTLAGQSVGGAIV